MSSYEERPVLRQFYPCHSNERGEKLVLQTLYLHSSLYVRHFALFIKVLEVSVDHVPAR